MHQAASGPAASAPFRQRNTAFLFGAISIGFRLSFD